MSEDTEKLAAGQVRWHSSGEDEGPDVGYEIGLPDGSTLWIGEITKSLAESTVEQSDNGWFAVHYRPGVPGLVMGRVEPSWLDFGGPDELAAALRTPPTDTPDGELARLRSIALRIIEDVSHIEHPSKLSPRTVTNIVFDARKAMNAEWNESVEAVRARLTPPVVAQPTAEQVVTEAMIDAALQAPVPGGSNVWVWLPQKDAWTPHETARTVMRCALEAALPKAEDKTTLPDDGLREIPREPTEAMIEAGEEFYPCSRGTESRHSSPNPEEVWRAMWDAALSGKGVGQ